MRRFLAVAALVAVSILPLPALAAGAFVTRTIQDGFGVHVTQLYDMSGTGVGPFLNVVVPTDGAGNIAGGGSGGSGGAVYGPDNVGVAPTKPPVLNGYVDENGLLRSWTGTLLGGPLVTIAPTVAASGKVTTTITSVAAATSTQIAAANANRIAYWFQCANAAGQTYPLEISETGATLASAAFGSTGGTLYVPAGSAPYYSPSIPSLSALTAYTATAQICVVNEVNK